jgi:hypothetical protein
VNPMDISELAADADNIIGGLPSHRTRGPIMVTRNGEPEAYIIRAQAWAPKLHHFDFNQGRIICTLCYGTEGKWGAPTGDHLGEALERANKHWRDTHQEKRR